MQSIDLAIRLNELRVEKDKLSEEIKETEEMLYQSMINNNTDNYYNFGYSCRIVSKTKVKISNEQKYELHKRLKKKGFGHIINEFIAPNILTDFIVEQVEQNAGILPIWLRSLVKIYEEPLIIINKEGK